MSWPEVAQAAATVLGAGTIAAWLSWRAAARQQDTIDAESDAEMGRHLRDELRDEMDRRDQIWQREIDRLNADNERCMEQQAEMRVQLGVLEREFARCHSERALLESQVAELRERMPRDPFA